MSWQILWTKETGSNGDRVLKNTTGGISIGNRVLGTVSLQHCVSSLTEVNNGFVAGLRISASSLLISASMSPSESESVSTAAPLDSVVPYS